MIWGPWGLRLHGQQELTSDECGCMHMMNAYEEWTMRNGPLQHSNTITPKSLLFSSRHASEPFPKPRTATRFIGNLLPLGILAAQLPKHLLGILLRAVTDVGIGNGGLVWRYG